MKFSASIEYAIHGLIYLANGPAGKTTLIADVAKAIEVPEAYLRKVFQQLVRSGIVTSQRGARGGFFLAHEPSRISLKEVVESIEGSLPLYSCLKEQRRCTLGPYCPVREAFDEARERMAEVLEATSIKNLRDELSKHTNEISWLRVSA